MKLSTYEITRQIADLLPEPMWSEVFRRLRFAPETWQELSDTDTLHAWLQRPAALQIASWQPLLFQLWLYGRTNPAAGNDVAQWLQNTDAGNAAINEALKFLLSASSGKQFDAQTALLASFALAQKLASENPGCVSGRTASLSCCAADAGLLLASAACTSNSANCPLPCEPHWSTNASAASGFA